MRPLVAGVGVVAVALLANATSAGAVNGPSPHDQFVAERAADNGAKMHNLAASSGAKSVSTDIHQMIATSSASPNLAQLRSAVVAARAAGAPHKSVVRKSTAVAANVPTVTKPKPALRHPSKYQSLVDGANPSGPIVLPLGDGIADSMQIQVATGELGPGADLSVNHDFAIANSVSTNVILKSFSGIMSTRVSVDDRSVCDPNDVNNGYVDPADCPNVRDIWTFSWDGTDSTPAVVLAGVYTVLDTTLSTEVGNVGVVPISLVAVSSDHPTPVVLAPLSDGVADSASVVFSGTTYGGSAIPTTGAVEMTENVSGAVVDRFDFGSAEAGHTVSLQAPDYPLGDYTLTADLQFDGVHQQTTLPVKVVSTAVTGARVPTPGTIFPVRDGYRDYATFRLATTTTTGTVLPVRGSIQIDAGGRVILRLPVTRSNQAVSWNGKVGTRQMPAGTYGVRAVIAGPQGAAITSARSTFAIAQTKVTRAGVSLSASSVFPIRDGYRDYVTITTAGSSSTGSALSVAGTLQVLNGSNVLWSTRVSSTDAQSFAWNGRSGGSLNTGTFTVKLTMRGPEGVAAVRTARITVSGKHLVSHTSTYSHTYTASYARDDCGGTGYHDCEDNYSWYIGGSSYSAVTRYYNGASSDDIIWSAHSLALPSGTTSYRLQILGATYDAQYYFIRCIRDASDPNDCPSGDGAKFPLADYGGGTYDAGWSSTGVGDGYADFAIAASDWGSVYIARYVLTAKRTYKVLE